MNAGTDLLFAPEVTEMFHAPITTSIRVGGITDRLEGAMRPGHFDGVATVVAKLLSIIGSCHAYFGEKDWQQLAVVRRIVADLSIDAIIVGCPTIRDNDGLALSSRNAYLTVDERVAAVSLSAALWHGVKLLNAGERVSAALETEMRARVSPRAVIDYCVAVAADTLEPIEPLRGAIRLLIAARFQSARLIDNMGVTMP